MSIRLLLLLCLVAISVVTLHAESRLWVSKDGTAKMTATFQKMEGERVILILANGRSQIVDKKFLSDADLQWIAEHPGTQTMAANSTSAGTTTASAKIPTVLKGKLVDEKGKPVDLTAGGSTPKYYLFYYSASWCGPCHAFTPDLIRFYEKMKGRKADFEVILYPSDRSAEDELAYMKEMRMPWPGLAFDQRAAEGIPRNTAGFIPAMVLVDAEGQRLLEVNREFSKAEFLEKAEGILKTGGATAQN